MQPSRSLKRARLILRIVLFVGLIVNISDTPYCAVTFDGSTVARGNSASLSGPDYVIEAGMGTQKGTNLFHSFKTFDIATGETATFTETGATGSISNIISRITGGSASSIDGGIASTIPGANLYLMNPYGFMFGPNAWISVPGSFHVTTADYLRMADGARFYADLGKASVLSTEPVSAFGFLTNNPAPISIMGSDDLNTPTILSVFSGQALSLVGGDITMANTWLMAEAGQVNIISAASPGEVVVNQPGQVPSVDASSLGSLGSITVSNFSMLDVSGAADGTTGPGTIIVRGGRLLLDASYLSAFTYGGAAGNPVGVDIDVTGDFTLTNASAVLAQTYGAADGPGISVRADTIHADTMALINTATFEAGKGGDVTVNAESLQLNSGGEISANSKSQGQGGNLSVRAKNILITSDLATIDAGLMTGLSAQASGAGLGGSLEVSADNLQVLDAGAISTNAYDAGNGGNLLVQANTILVSGLVYGTDGTDYHSRIESRVAGETATGRGGNIEISAGRVTLGNGGYVGTYLVYGSPGEAGNITVKAPTVILDPQGKIESSSVLGAGSNAVAGNIAISSNKIVMTGTSEETDARVNFTGVRSDTLDGAGGNVDITTGDLTLSKGARIISDSSGSGRGGTITINADQIALASDATISARSTGAGWAGNIALNVTKISMDAGFLSTEAQQTDGGDITMTGKDMVYLLNSRISTSVNGGPETTGGNIVIDPRHVVLNNSSIIANAYEGHGGSISIVSDVFLASPESVVSASSQLGIDGTVDIQSPVTDISGTLAPMKGGFLQSADMVRDSCVARLQGKSQSSLTVTGRDGLPPRPGMVLPASVF